MQFNEHVLDIWIYWFIYMNYTCLPELILGKLIFFFVIFITETSHYFSIKSNLFLKQLTYTLIFNDH